jgi:hypothetical protein
MFRTLSSIWQTRVCTRIRLLSQRPYANIRPRVAALSHPLSSPPKPGPETNPVESAISDALVREELDRILSSHDFQASKLCQGFLRYVVESTLNGHTDSLKERTIGIEVFGKTTSYDPSEDAGVRVKAGEVRKRLRSYYLNQPAEAKVLIELPSGTYIPEFHLLQPAEQSGSAKSWGRSWLFLTTLCAVLLGLAIAAFFWLRPHPVVDSVDQFWSPVFQSHKAVLVCTAAVPVYSDVRNSSVTQPARVQDFVLIPNRFVAVSDVNSATQIAEMFGRMGEPYKLRIGNDVSFRDLRTTPAILVGFSYTLWHEIGEHFRYSIDLSQRPFGVSENGSLTAWTIKTHPDDPALDEDYAIVSRVFYPGTNSVIVEITGISHYGTEAAADLVTNPALLQEALHRLPPGWQQKNVQIVLHVDVISGSPTVPTVVATHVW